MSEPAPITQTTSAQQRVLLLPELLELVLSHLAPPDWPSPALELYTLQRVCRSWHSTISHSHILQQHMGLLPFDTEPYTFRATAWLLLRLGHACTYDRSTAMMNVSELDTTSTTKRPVESLLASPAMGRAHASWRRMKLPPSVAVRVPVRYALEVHDLLLPEQGARRYFRSYLEIWRIEDDGQTVVDVLRKYESVMARRVGEHQRVKADRTRQMD